MWVKKKLVFLRMKKDTFSNSTSGTTLVNASEWMDKLPTPVSDPSSDDVSNIGHLILVHITPLSTINLHPLLLLLLHMLWHQSGLPTWEQTHGGMTDNRQNFKLIEISLLIWKQLSKNINLVISEGRLNTTLLNETWLSLNPTEWNLTSSY